MKYAVSTKLAALFLLVASTSLMPTKNACADIAFKGSSAANDVLIKWYDQQIPSCFHGKQKIAFYVYNDSEMDKYLTSIGLSDGTSYASSNAGEIDGLFDNRRMKISLRVTNRGEYDQETLTHEYGHYVWFHILPDSDRKAYREIYDRQKRANCLVTDYAKVNLEEGFAEAFAFFIVEPGALKQKDEASFDFLQTFMNERTPSELARQNAPSPNAVSLLSLPDESAPVSRPTTPLIITASAIEELAASPAAKVQIAAFSSSSAKPVIW